MTDKYDYSDSTYCCIKCEGRGESCHAEGCPNFVCFDCAWYNRNKFPKCRHDRTVAGETMTADEYFAKIGFKLSYLMEAYEKFKRETGKINEAYEHREYVKKKNKEGIPKKIFTLHRKVAQ